jgi:hypothetical protein
MELKVRIPFQGLIALVGKLSPAPKARLKYDFLYFMQLDVLLQNKTYFWYMLTNPNG